MVRLAFWCIAFTKVFGGHLSNLKSRGGGGGEWKGKGPGKGVREGSCRVDTREGKKMIQIRIMLLEKLGEQNSGGIAPGGTRAAGFIEGLGHLLRGLLRVSPVMGGKSRPGLI